MRRRRSAWGVPILAVAALFATPAWGQDETPSGEMSLPALDRTQPEQRAALDAWQRAQASPADAEPRNDLGCLLAWSGHWPEAVDALEKAAALNPKDSRPTFNLGLAFARQENWRKARKAFKESVERDARNWPAWWMLGLAEEKLGNVNAAVTAYSRSVTIDTTLFEVKHNPYAPLTALKARTFLETYPTRVVKAGFPFADQLSSPASIGASLEAGRPRAPEVVKGRETPAEEGRSGPVVTSISPSGNSSSGADSGRQPARRYPGADRTNSYRDSVRAQREATRNQAEARPPAVEAAPAESSAEEKPPVTPDPHQPYSRPGFPTGLAPVGVGFPVSGQPGAVTPPPAQTGEPPVVKPPTQGPGGDD